MSMCSFIFILIMYHYCGVSNGPCTITFNPSVYRVVGQVAVSGKHQWIFADNHEMNSCSSFEVKILFLLTFSYFRSEHLQNITAAED